MRGVCRLPLRSRLCADGALLRGRKSPGGSTGASNTGLSASRMTSAHAAHVAPCSIRRPTRFATGSLVDPRAAWRGGRGGGGRGRARVPHGAGGAEADSPRPITVLFGSRIYRRAGHCHHPPIGSKAVIHPANGVYPAGSRLGSRPGRPLIRPADGAGRGAGAGAGRAGGRRAQPAGVGPATRRHPPSECISTLGSATVAALRSSEYRSVLTPQTPATRSASSSSVAPARIGPRRSVPATANRQV